MRLQKRVDGIGDAGRFGAEQSDKSFREKRKHEAYDVIIANSQRMEHVGGLRHSRDEIAVGNHDGRVCRVGIGEELDSGSIGIFGCPELDGIIGALGCDALGVGSPFEGSDIGFRCKSRIFVADQSIERMYARHGLLSPVSFPSAVRF
jgi:hypothetical protein